MSYFSLRARDLPIKKIQEFPYRSKTENGITLLHLQKNVFLGILNPSKTLFTEDFQKHPSEKERQDKKS